jgi:hypothetical protein
MSEQPDLFPVQTVLSPRLRWIKRHKVVTYQSCPEDRDTRPFWYAAFDYGDWPGYEDAGDFFAQEIAANGDMRLGIGPTEDDALLDLCAKRQVRHWTVEAHCLPASSHGPRFRLWELLHSEHKLTLLDSELDDIIDKACACRPIPAPPGVQE